MENSKHRQQLRDTHSKLPWTIPQGSQLSPHQLSPAPTVQITLPRLTDIILFRRYRPPHASLEARAVLGKRKATQAHRL